MSHYLNATPARPTPRKDRPWFTPDPDAVRRLAAAVARLPGADPRPLGRLDLIDALTGRYGWSNQTVGVLAWRLAVDWDTLCAALADLHGLTPLEVRGLTPGQLRELLGTDGAGQGRPTECGLHLTGDGRGPKT